MKRAVIFKKFWQRALYRVLCVLVSGVYVASVWCGQHARAANPVAGPAWASPTAKAVKRIGAVDPVQHQPTFLSNLDCVSLTYRMVNSTGMRTGCFVPTAFGLLDSSNGVVIFNGTDEAVSLAAYTPKQVLVPWPKAGNLLTTDALGTGGSVVSMYRNASAALRDQSDGAGHVIGKQLATPPETLLFDQSGRRLTVNTQTISFSEGGGWLVAATIYGSFVRINLSTLEVLPFASVFYNSSGAAPQDAQVAISRDGRFVAIENNPATSFKVYDLAGCAAKTADWQLNKCPSYEYWPFIAQQISGLRSITHVRFVNDGLISFEDVSSGSSAGPGVYELAPVSSIGALIDYLGMGDSYTSGEGAFNYLSGTDTDTNHCHLSESSYPLLLSQDLFGNGGHSVACSGAIMWDVGNSSGQYRGQVENGSSFDELTASPGKLETILASYTPGVIAQHRFVQYYQPRAVTVSIGGNDIGFGDILQNCVAPHLSLRGDGQTCYRTYEDRVELTKVIDRAVPRWTALYKQLRAEAPQSQLYAIGYPSMAVADGQCGLNVRLSHDELVFADALLAYLNKSMQQAATAAQIPYVDISKALVGHRLCETSGNSVAMNGLTAGTDSLGILGRESYHPNMLGQRLIEQEILKQSDNLKVGFSSSMPPAGDPGQTLLAAPKSGRPLNVLVPDTQMLSPVMRPAATSALRVDGTRDGLRANATYAVRLDGPDGQVLSTAQSDSGGSLSTYITLPADTAAGSHTINVIGSNQVGENVNITQTISVPGEENNITDVPLVSTVSNYSPPAEPPSSLRHGSTVKSIGVSTAVLAAHVKHGNRMLRHRVHRAENAAYKEVLLRATKARHIQKASRAAAGLLLIIALVFCWHRWLKPPKHTV